MKEKQIIISPAAWKQRATGQSLLTPFLVSYIIANIFFQFFGLNLSSFVLSFKESKFIILIYHSSFSLYALTSPILLWGYKEILLYFFLKVFKLCFSHVSMVHLEFNFVYEVRCGYNFIFFHIKKQLSRFNNWSVCPLTRDVQLYKNSHSLPICKSLFWGTLYCILLVLNIHRLLDFHINCIYFFPTKILELACSIPGKICGNFYWNYAESTD